mgnify:CR=1 FL=1
MKIQLANLPFAAPAAEREKWIFYNEKHGARFM